MQLKTILNRVEHYKSFVYSEDRLVKDTSSPAASRTEEHGNGPQGDELKTPRGQAVVTGP